MAGPVKRAVETLNEALACDAGAITQLINMRVDCDKALAAHPTIQVSRYGKVHRVGVLGLINGAIGDSPTGDIGAEGPMDGKTGNFTRMQAFRGFAHREAGGAGLKPGRRGIAAMGRLGE